MAEHGHGHEHGAKVANVEKADVTLNPVFIFGGVLIASMIACVAIVHILFGYYAALERGEFRNDPANFPLARELTTQWDAEIKKYIEDKRRKVEQDDYPNIIDPYMPYGQVPPPFPFESKLRKDGDPFLQKALPPIDAPVLEGINVMSPTHSGVPYWPTYATFLANRDNRDLNALVEQDGKKMTRLEWAMEQARAKGAFKAREAPAKERELFNQGPSDSSSGRLPRGVDR